MNGLTKLGTILTVVFLVSLLALVAELLYVLFRRQTFRRRSAPFHSTTSKEQLFYYLFCWKNQIRIEPTGNPQDPASEDSEAAAVDDDDDVAKWRQAVYGPSRVLFTIKEEEREGTETASEAENEIVKSKTGSFDHAESVSEGEVVVVRIDQGVDDETMPFSTPCASPPYYTPSPSPTHEKYNTPGNGEAEMILEGENDVSFVSLEVNCV